MEIEPIQCHKLVMCSLIHTWQAFIQEDTDRVTLPDFDHDRLQQFVDGIYRALASTTDLSWRDLDPDMAAFLHIDPSVLEAPAFPADLPYLKVDDDTDLMGKWDSEGEMDTKDICEEAINIFNEAEERDIPVWSAHEVSLEADSASEEATDDSEFELPGRKAVKRRSCSMEPANETSRKIKRRASSRPGRALAKNSILFQEQRSENSIDDEAIRTMIKTKSSGDLWVDMTTSSIKLITKKRIERPLTKHSDAFFALIGVQQTEGEIWGQSLGWTTDVAEEVEQTFEDTLSAFQAVFGLTRASLRGAFCFRDNGRLKTKHQFRFLYEKYVHQYTRDELENELNQPALISAFETPTPTWKAVSLPLKNYAIHMKSELTHFDDIVLVGVYKHGIEIRKLIQREGIDSMGTSCARLLTMVWVGGSDKAKFAESQEICNAYEENQAFLYARNKIRKLLATNDEFPRPKPAITCDVCGKLFKEGSFRSTIQSHMTRHKIEQFKCNCDVKFDSYVEKRKHYLSHHSRMSQLRRPIEPKKKAPTYKFVPKPHVCDICGTILGSKGAMQRHVRRNHIHCRHCNKEYASGIAYVAHWKKLHPDLVREIPKSWVACDDCDAIFYYKSKYLIHWRTVHGSDEVRQFKCGVCTKSFDLRPHLKAHVLNMHIKSRPYKCRSDGCESTFNSVANLYAHEKKIHGEAFGSSISLDLVVSDQQLLDLGCQLGRQVRV
ncbi:hypothetical protein TCAL_05052 [Tigriopus californicus]|uniref:C2H2-type domain-containing protein n=1 Tax=Tigriopus californicus TaxID=6832 RepID=A0A553P729_TIGCA|nr:hypothetical protein TCAL_05052 [Tigriopus californicus]